MTCTLAALLGFALAVAFMALVVGTCLLIRWWDGRRLARRWKAALQKQEGNLIILPSSCTCCPIHGHANAQGVTKTGGEVSPKPGGDPKSPEIADAP